MYPQTRSRSSGSKDAFPLGPSEISAALVVLGSLRRHVTLLCFVSQGTKFATYDVEDSHMLRLRRTRSNARIFGSFMLAVSVLVLCGLHLAAQDSASPRADSAASGRLCCVTPAARLGQAAPRTAVRLCTRPFRSVASPSVTSALPWIQSSRTPRGPVPTSPSAWTSLV